MNCRILQKSNYITALRNKRKRKATLLHNEELDLCMRMWTRLTVECVTLQTATIHTSGVKHFLNPLLRTGKMVIYNIRIWPSLKSGAPIKY